MNKLIFILVVFTALLGACKNKISESNTNKEATKTETKTSETKYLKTKIEILFKHLEKDMKFGATTPTQLRQYYDIGEGDEHENYFIKSSDLDGSNSLFYNFSFKENKLAYITFKASNKPLEIEAFLTTKFGNPTVQSEEFKDRKDWSQSNYNIVFWNRPDWELNIEPKDYSPEF